jgi:hypothetical protein
MTVLPLLDYVDAFRESRPGRDAEAERAAAGEDLYRETPADRAGE